MNYAKVSLKVSTQNIKRKTFIYRCNRVSKEVIIKNILNGNNNLESIKALTKAFTSCGGCEHEIEKIILEFTWLSY